MLPRVKEPKVFKQIPFKGPELVREDLPHGRFYYEPSKGIRCPSATTVLSHLDDSNWVEEWRAAVGDEFADKVSREATAKGTGLHWLCETYVTNNDINAELKKSLSVLTGRFLNLVPTLNRIDNVIGSELQMISYAWNMAGTTDLIATFDGRLEVIDYKTSKKVKTRDDIHSYFVQLCAYSRMFRELSGHDIKYGRIIMSVEGRKEPLMFVELLSNWEPLLLKAKEKYEKATEGR